MNLSNYPEIHGEGVETESAGRVSIDDAVTFDLSVRPIDLHYYVCHGNSVLLLGSDKERLRKKGFEHQLPLFEARLDSIHTDVGTYVKLSEEGKSIPPEEYDAFCGERSEFKRKVPVVFVRYGLKD